LTPGSRAFFPVHVPGANLSVGDLHFSQGDGKINGFGGVKMSGWIDLQVRVLRDGVARYGVTRPTLEPRAAGTRCEAIAFQGVAVGEEGRPRYRDVWLAFADAYREAIRHLERFGYSGEQVYALLSAAPVQEKLTGARGHPNVSCTVMAPIDIFEFDARTTAEGMRMPRGELARPS
jgi:formamidase